MLTGWTWGVVGRLLIVLVAPDIAFGALAVYSLDRASSSTVR